MFTKIKELFKHRELLKVMVSRELKGRYRGTVFGFLWSFINPLLLLVVYSVVFGFILPGGSGRVKDINIVGVNYSIFMFIGLLPWIWYCSSILESANVLFVQSNLVKKIKFPLEILPLTSVLTNMIHYILGLPILVIFIIIFGGSDIHLSWCYLFLPVALLVQFIFTLGLSFIVSALTVYFRDLKDILNNLLTFWFFATPIIYHLDNPAIQKHKALSFILSLNPMTHIIESYQHIFFFGSLSIFHYKKLGVTLLVGVVLLFLGYRIFNLLRDTFVEEV